MWSVDKYMRGMCGGLIVASALLLTACDKGVSPVLGELVCDSVTCNAAFCHVEVVEGVPDDYTFYYATTKSGAEKNSAASVKGTYSESIVYGVVDGLPPNTTYHIRVCAMNGHGRANTETIEVKTAARVPVLDDNNYPTID